MQNKVYRGTLLNPKNRFFDIWYEKNLLEDKKTKYIEFNAKSIISRNFSPDTSVVYTLNPYRGCEHGCVYCYARPYHEYYSESLGLDFESRIYVKINAPQLLKTELQKINFQCVTISGVTDPYQPVESKYMLTRKCLEVFLEMKSPVIIITKNSLVTRDIDILKKLAELNIVCVILSITTLSESLKELLEPRTSKISMRFKALNELSRNDIPCGVMIAPVIPGLTDHEVPNILKKAKAAGASYAGYSILRLPYAVKDLFLDWLSKKFPLKYNKVIESIKKVRNGRLTDSNFYTRFSGTGKYADFINNVFCIFFKKYGYKDFPRLKSPNNLF